ncbi:MAG TPA: hypothetical protein VGE07_09090, partial [Herpetosiphonaceae bacterium]
MVKKSIGLIALLSLLSLLLPLGTRAQQAAAPTIEKAATAPVVRTGRAISSELSATKNLPQDSDALPNEILLRNWASNELGPAATPTQIELRAAELKDEWLATSYHGPESAKLAELVTNERAIAKGDTSNARTVDGTLRLLTVAVEFDGSDTATNFSHPISIDNRTCITETITYDGPRHNEIPMPGPRD